MWICLLVLSNFRDGLKKNISFNNFEKKLHKHEFYIDVEYYSEFERSILLHGKFQNHDSVLKITDINNISFIYE